jgi:hypothetical protein
MRSINEYYDQIDEIFDSVSVSIEKLGECEKAITTACSQLLSLRREGFSDTPVAFGLTLTTEDVCRSLIFYQLQVKIAVGLTLASDIAEIRNWYKEYEQ